MGVGFVWLQTFTVDTRGIGAVQVGQRITAANVFKRGMYTRNSIRTLRIAEVNLWLSATEVMIVTTYQRTFAGKLHLATIAKGQRTPDSVGIKGRLRQRFWRNGLGSYRRQDSRAAYNTARPAVVLCRGRWRLGFNLLWSHWRCLRLVALAGQHADQAAACNKLPVPVFSVSPGHPAVEQTEYT